jgi:K+-sensing histidine kinase KdpD
MVREERPRAAWRRRAASWLACSVALLAPLALAAAWIPVRSRLPNTDLALVLVLAVGAVGAFGRRWAVVVAAVSAAFWFEFFDTVPFERLAIARSPDVETTLVLAAAGAVVGELGLRTVRHRRALRLESEELSSVRAAAQLIASGEELVVVVDAVARELTRLLALDRCRFEASDRDAPRATVTRDGRIAWGGRLHRVGDRRLVAGLEVVAQQQVLGRFVLEAGRRARLGRDRLLVAVTLADQAGAAFLAQAPPPPPPGAPDPERGLRVVTATAAPAGEQRAPRPQETAGVPSSADRMIS